MCIGFADNFILTCFVVDDDSFSNGRYEPASYKTELSHAWDDNKTKRDKFLFFAAENALII